MHCSRKLEFRVSAFEMLILFAVSFFIYNDFNIRMIYGYSLLIITTIFGLLFSNSRITISSIKLWTIILALILTIIILIGSKNIELVLAIDICVFTTIVSDVNINQVKSSIRFLMVVATLISIYVILVKINSSFYYLNVSRYLSTSSRAVNKQMLRDGYGITLGGNIVFIDYVLTLTGMLCANMIMTFKSKLRFKWAFWGVLSICLVGMLLENRKSELLVFLVGLFFCFREHISNSTLKEKTKMRIIVLVVLLVSIICISYLASEGYLDRYLRFFERLNYNAQSSGYKEDVTSGRLVLWSIAITIFLQNPILGIGWGNFHSHLPSSIEGINNVHNNYIQLLCETGIVGFILIMTPMVYIFINTIRYKCSIFKKNCGRVYTPYSIVTNMTSYGLQISFFILSFLDPCFYKMSFYPFWAIAIMMAKCTQCFRQESVLT